MKLVFIFFIILFLTNCSLNKDSKYWTEDLVKKSEDQKKLSEVLKTPIVESLPIIVPLPSLTNI